jgi:two-component system response regulator DevR
MQPASSIRVLIVDDHPVVRSGLRVIGALDPAIRVVGEAASVAEAMTYFRNLIPDVVLLDLRLPDGSGVDVCRQAKLERPEVRVICLTSFSEPALVLAAVAAGADAYLLKHSDAERIVEAIHAVRRGEQVFDAGIMEAATFEKLAGQPVDRLTPAERRVLEQVVRGLTDKEVAQALGLSAKTVRNCLDRAFAKLGVHSRTQAALAFTQGISFGEEAIRGPLHRLPGA